jgi:NAD(P)-dependent dehydrogenase (short-subunit alcohol dehydrogenase family)
MLAPAIADPNTKAFFASLSPFKRLGTVADIGDAVALTVSESARWISGQSIVVAVCFTFISCISVCTRPLRLVLQ